MKANRRQPPKPLGSPRVAVIGDVMLDRTICVDPGGITPEYGFALKLREVDRKQYCGGAANVFANLVSLGAQPSLVGVVGDDDEADALGDRLRQMDAPHGVESFADVVAHQRRIERDVHLVRDYDRATTLKQRIVDSEGRLLFRLDREGTDGVPLALDDWERLIKVAVAGAACIVVSDYCKGVVTHDLMELLRSFDLPIFVDPKRNLSFYGRVTCLKPNLRSYAGPGGSDVLSGDAEVTIVTAAEHGCSLYRQGARKGTYPVRQRKVVDSTGCGDSFMAGLVTAFCSGWSLEQACSFGNACGAVAVGYRGTWAVDRDDAQQEWSSFPYLEES